MPACPRCKALLDPDGSCFACGRPQHSANGEVRQWRRIPNEPPPVLGARPAADERNSGATGSGGPEINGDLAQIASRYTPVDWTEAWGGQPAETDWLFEPVLETGTVNALFAKPGTGKSLLALEIALALVRRGRTVVYVDDENRIVDLVERLQAFGASPAELGRLRLYSFAGLPALDTPLGGAHLLALAATGEAALVVLDTTTRMVAGRENDADTFLQLYRCSLVPLKSRGITVLRLDHPGKDGDRGQRGSSAKDGDVDTIWKMTEVTKGLKYTLHRDKSRSGHGDAEDLILRRHYEPLRHEWTCPDSSPMDKIIGQLSQLQVPPSAGRDRCRTALAKAGIPVSNDLLTAVVRKRKLAPDSYGTAGQPSDRAADCPDPRDVRPGDRTGEQAPVPCWRCGQPMTITEPGQTTHPSCDPDGQP